jgi:hypothetical protein
MNIPSSDRGALGHLFLLTLEIARTGIRAVAAVSRRRSE